jgi:hypothetical protein
LSAAAVPTATTSTTSAASLVDNLGAPLPLLIGAVVIGVLALASLGVYLFFSVRDRGKKKPAPLAPVAVVAEAVPVPAISENTEFIGRVSPDNLTQISNRRQLQQQLPKACLLVKPDREIQLSRQKETVIGRDATNAAFVDDRQVSRHHARILVVDGDFWIEDLNSTNGTRVNGATVTKQKLANNDLINVGDTTLTFALEQA